MMGRPSECVKSITSLKSRDREDDLNLMDMALSMMRAYAALIT